MLVQRVGVWVVCVVTEVLVLVAAFTCTSLDRLECKRVSDSSPEVMCATGSESEEVQYEMDFLSHQPVKVISFRAIQTC